MDKHTAEAIARGLRAGERQAWLGLYEAYAERLWKNVGRLMGFDCAEAADVVQNTFLAAARSAKNFDPGRGSLWSWLWGIARRQIALYYRKEAPRSRFAKATSWWISLDSEKNDWIDAKCDPPQDVLETREMATLVRRVLSELSDEYQTLLIGKYVDEQSIDKMAKDVNCSGVAVRSKLARARRAFRKTFRMVAQSMSDTTEVSS